MSVSRGRARRLRLRAEAREAKLDAVTRALGGMRDEDATRPYDKLAAAKAYGDALDAMVYGLLSGKTGSKQASQALADSQALLNSPRTHGLRARALILDDVVTT